MPTEEIPRKQWKDFFDSFSRRHEGWLVTLQLLSEDLGAQPAVEVLSFAGISANSSDVGDSFVISLARSTAEHVTHMVQHPQRVWLLRTDELESVSLEIEAQDQSRTLLSIRSPMLPELVDGIV